LLSLELLTLLAIFFFLLGFKVLFFLSEVLEDGLLLVCGGHLVIFGPSEEKLIQGLHHFAVLFNCNVDMHRVVVYQFVQEQLLLFREQAVKLFEDIASFLDSLLDRVLVECR